MDHPRSPFRRREFFSGPQPTRRTTARHFFRRLAVEPLEDRRLLAIVKVDTTSDVLDGVTTSLSALVANPGADGVISLREAIRAANNSANIFDPDEIHFSIPGPGPHSIRPLAALPTITDSLVIDGYTQLDAAVNTIRAGSVLGLDTELRIVLDGSVAGNVSGLTITASDSAVRGLAVGNFQGSGIAIDGGDRNKIQGNFIGTDATGMSDLANGQNGVVIRGSASFNLIGGNDSTDPAVRNLISGNVWDGVRIRQADHTIVSGNLIGVSRMGTVAIANRNGVFIEDGAIWSRIGTDGDGLADGDERNVISGNTFDGVLIADADTDHNVVAGNLIGTNLTGTAALRNEGHGVRILAGAQSNVVGTDGSNGNDASKGNVISGNQWNGVDIQGAGTDQNVVAGNIIGLDAMGNAALGNSLGVLIHGGAKENRIGGGNRIGANSLAGVRMEDAGTDNNVVMGNLIGFGRAELGNGRFGVAVGLDAGRNIIGGTDPDEGNVIAFNGWQDPVSGTYAGVHVDDANSRGNSIRGNSIHSNVGPGINLGPLGVTANDESDTDTGPNNLQNFPALTSAEAGGRTRVVGELKSEPQSEFLIDVYASSTPDPSSYGEGERWLGSFRVRTGTSGLAAFDEDRELSESQGGEWITATATRLDLAKTLSGEPTDTSEFSPSIAAAVRMRITDADVVEGDGGTTKMLFGVYLWEPSTLPVSVNWASIGLSAMPGNDYQSGSGTLVFHPGQTYKPVEVLVFGDLEVESGEAFVVYLTDPVGGILDDDRGLATILTDEFVVNTTDDRLDADPTDGKLDVNLQMPDLQVSLRAAIVAANAMSGHNTIIVPAGNYRLTIQGPNEQSAWMGDLDITDSLTITGAGADSTMVDAGGLDDWDSGTGDRVFAVHSNAILNLAGVTLSNGWTDEGGGILVHSGSRVTITESTLSDNHASKGGAVYVKASGELTLTASTLHGNEALFDGGGIYSEAGARTSIEVSTLSGNAADKGGGVFNSGRLSLSYSTLTENVADLGGGGIFSDLGSGTDIRSTIVAENRDSPDVYGEVRSLGHNLVGNDSLSSGWSVRDGDKLKTNPLLLPLQDNGGPTLTHALPPWSPAIDAGDNTAAPDTDQRGFNRVVDGDDNGTDSVDIGAYELQLNVIWGTIWNDQDGGRDRDADEPGLGGWTIYLDDDLDGRLSPTDRSTTTDSDGRYFFAGVEAGTYTIAVDQRLGWDPTAPTTPNQTVTFSAPGITRDLDFGFQFVPPKLSIDDVSVVEGDSGTTVVLFTVSMSRESDNVVWAHYGTRFGTADGSDYQTTWGTLRFQSPQTQQTISVVVYADAKIEPHETFFVALSSPYNATLADSQAVGTILNDDTAISIGDVGVIEGDSALASAQFTVTLEQASALPVTADYATLAGTATVSDDFLGASGQVRFAPGETNKPISVAVQGDQVLEPNETFYVALANPTGATFTDQQGTAVILDDDGFEVNSFRDAPDVNPGDGQVHTGRDGEITLRAAIMEANARPGYHSIILRAGTYGLEIRGANEDAAATGDLDITDALSITGSGDERTIVNASGLFDQATGVGDRAFHVVGNASLSLSGVTISHGSAAEGGGIRSSGRLAVVESTLANNTADSGGAIFNDGGTVDVDASMFVGNSGTYGGAIYSAGATSTLAIANTTLARNSAEFGGAVYNDGGAVEITGSTLTENRAGDSGGGMYTAGITSRVTVAKTRFAGNSATSGGSAYNNKGSLGINDSTFADNRAQSFGGGIYNTGTTSIWSVANSTLSGNEAGKGGGVYNDGGTGEIKASTFAGNSATSPNGGGGGVYSVGTTARVTIADSTFSDNQAGLYQGPTGIPGDGGGVHNESGAVEVIRSTFIRNSASSDGGAIYNSQALSTLTISESTLSRNSAGYQNGRWLILSGNGGGVYNVEGAVDISGSTFYANSATFAGGGLHNTGAASVVFTNSTFSDNSAAAGGGVYNSSGAMWIHHSTLTGNTTARGRGNGGGVYSRSGATTSVSNAIIANNLASERVQQCVSWTYVFPYGYYCLSYIDTWQSVGSDADGIFASAGHNLVKTSGSSSGWIKSGASADLLNVDPKLGTLADNGGPTRTHTLLPGSPAIDAGDNPDGPTVDQRGLPRVFDGDGNGLAIVDIGAVERNDGDNDGVDDGLESLVGNGSGDGNHDGIPDESQPNVVSLPNLVDQRFVTLVTSAGTFAGVRSVSVPGGSPSGFQYPIGLFEYEVRNIGVGGAVSVTLLPPQGTTLDAFYKYGPTLDNRANHWYEFLYDGTTRTGAERLDDDGDSYTDRVVLHFVDGLRGDDDLSANGVVVDPAGPALYAYVPPTAHAGGPYVENEGTFLKLDGSASNDLVQPTASLIFEWDLNYDGATFDVDLTGMQPEVAFADDYPPSTVALRVTDSDGLSHIATTTLEIQNASPVISGLSSDATMLKKGSEGMPVTVVAGFTDAGTADGHTARIDWGDGTDSYQQTWDPTGGSASIEAAHTYAAGGIYTVTLTVEDDDGGIMQQTTTAVLSGVGVNNGVLYIIGTSENDLVLVDPKGQNQLKVHANFLPDGPHRTLQADTVDRIIAYLAEGDDLLRIASSVKLPAVVHGGAGNDLLNAGGGPAVLLGDEGNDLLLGGQHRNVLIGGLGFDMLLGAKSEDLLIGGTTRFDQDDESLLLLLAEWRAEKPYFTRVENLRAGTGTSGIRLSKNLTVFDDDETDLLIGAADLDWFFFDSLDLAPGKSRREEGN